jgi:hypothetical protein
VDVRTWRIDITEQAAFLPPGPGASRWFLEWQNDSLWAGTVESMIFEVGGVEYAPDELPVTVGPNQGGFLLFPRPPILVIDSFETDPNPAAPGATVALRNIVLRNDGEATSGPVVCIAGSGDPDAINFSNTPATFGTELIPARGMATSENDLTFEIKAVHTDNTDIEVTLICTDGADTLTPSLLVPVPYPRPTTIGVRIEDPTGDNDGYADPGENVDVFITVHNDGAYATGAAVTATLTPLFAESSATFTTAATSSLTFGASPLEPDTSVESDVAFSLSLDASNLMGDLMVFDVVYSSDGDTWTEQLTIDVTDLPWVDCNEPLDPVGDNFAGSDFDIKGCASRSDGQILELRLDSWTPYDPAVTAVWFLMYEVPSVFSIEWVPPSLEFETGCIGGVNLPNPALIPTVESDGMSSIARLDVADLNEIGRNISVAFGAGYCAGPNDYCDTYPANATTFSSGNGSCNESLFIPISW